MVRIQNMKVAQEFHQNGERSVMPRAESTRERGSDRSRVSADFYLKMRDRVSDVVR